MGPFEYFHILVQAFIRSRWRQLGHPSPNAYKGSYAYDSYKKKGDIPVVLITQIGSKWYANYVGKGQAGKHGSNTLGFLSGRSQLAGHYSPNAKKGTVRQTR